MKLIVVDDHPLVRKGLIAVLNGEPSFEVVGEAETVEQSVEIIKRLQPELVLVDLRLGDKSGLSVIQQAREVQGNCKFVILTSSASEQDFLQAEKLGVAGYILKEALPEEIIHAIRIISRGRKYYDPGIIDIKMNMWNEDLTEREKEVLMALGKGLSNRDLAARFFVTENTIKKHVSQILSKLNLTDRTQAALYAYSKGLV